MIFVARLQWSAFQHCLASSSMIVHIAYLDSQHEESHEISMAVDVFVTSILHAERPTGDVAWCDADAWEQLCPHYVSLCQGLSGRVFFVCLAKA